MVLEQLRSKTGGAIENSFFNLYKKSCQKQCSKRPKRSGGANFVENYKSKAEPGYIWRSRDIYGGVGIQMYRLGDNPGIKKAVPLKIPSLSYTKNLVKISVQNEPGGAGGTILVKNDKSNLHLTLWVVSLFAS